MRSHAAICLIALLASASFAGDPWLRLAARMHPLAVHLPIALLLASALFELIHTIAGRIRSRPPSIAPSTLACLSLAVLGAGGAVASGWINADIEPHGRSIEPLIESHRWLAIATAGTALIAWILAVASRAAPSRPLVGSARTMILVSTILVSFTAHLGGSIVYGETYLTDPLRSALLGQDDSHSVARAPAGATDAKADPPPDEDAATQADDDPWAYARASFERDILPIFRARCAECHGEVKAYGEPRLRLHNWESVRAAIDTPDAVIVPGMPEVSELYARITLPPDDWDIMPADGDPLTPEQIETIRRWIESLAAPAERKIAEPAADSATDTDRSAPPASSASAPAPERAAIEDALARLRAMGAYAEHIARGDPRVIVNLTPMGPRADGSAIDALAGLEPVLTVLDLRATAVSDEDITRLRAFTALRSLDLAHTPAGDRAIREIGTLPHLEKLTLVGTRVSDDAIEALESMPALRELYLWQTDVSPEALARLRAARPQTRIIVDTLDDEKAPRT